MTQVAAVRRVGIGGPHPTEVRYIWAGRFARFRFVAHCASCGHLLDALEEEPAWLVARLHAVAARD